VEKYLGSVFAAAPSLALGFAGAWLDLFKNTAILRPDIPQAVINTALALSVLLAMGCVLLGRTWQPSYTARRGKELLAAAVFLAVFCFGLRMFLSWPRSYRVQSVLTPLWDTLGCVFVIIAILAITFAAIYWTSTDRSPDGSP
jgi:Co/Zn/Cd efflux system component